MRVAIMGDVGGHLEPFQRGLEALEMDKKLKLPKDLVVIQVGDLVHKGPHSNEIVAMVNQIIKANLGQWIQLVGNHEGQYVGGPEFWQDKVDLHSQRTLRSWWNKKKMITAVAVRDFDHDEDLLVTHAGLAPNFWSHFTNCESDAAKVASSINSWKNDIRHSAGYMLGQRMYAGGPIWAEATSEVYVPWWNIAEKNDPPVPFSQVHGHTTTYWWSRGRFSTHVPKEIIEQTTLDTDNNISTAMIGGKRFICVDPGFSKYTSVKVQGALVFEGDILGF